MVALRHAARTDLTERQKLACAFRILAGGGFAENIAGHITMARPGPGAACWSTRGACGGRRCTAGGPLPGRPRRPGARGPVGRDAGHPHPHRAAPARGPTPRSWSTTTPTTSRCWPPWGCCRSMVHQTTSHVRRRPGVRATSTPARWPPPSWAPSWPSGSATRQCVILANHGVIVTGATVAEATYRAATIDRQCRLMYDVVYQRPSRTRSCRSICGRHEGLAARAGGRTYYWGGAVRLLLRDQPDVLD